MNSKDCVEFLLLLRKSCKIQPKSKIFRILFSLHKFHFLTFFLLSFLFSAEFPLFSARIVAKIQVVLYSALPPLPLCTQEMVLTWREKCAIMLLVFDCPAVKGAFCYAPPHLQKEWKRFSTVILYASVAQLVEQLIRNQQVRCSSHPTSSKMC